MTRVTAISSIALTDLQNEKARILLVDQETFKKAVAYAISREQVKDPSIPDPYKSEEVNGVVLLRSSSSTIIAKVPIESLAEMTPEKVRALIATGNAPIRKADFSGSPQERAVAWATYIGDGKYFTTYTNENGHRLGRQVLTKKFKY